MGLSGLRDAGFDSTPLKCQPSHQSETCVASLPSSLSAFATRLMPLYPPTLSDRRERKHALISRNNGRGPTLNQCTCWALKICHSCSTAACSAICSSACPVAGAFGPIPGSRLSSSCLVFIGGRVRCTGCMARSNLTRASSSISRSVSSRTAPSVRSSNQNCGRCGHFEVPMSSFIQRQRTLTCAYAPDAWRMMDGATG